MIATGRVERETEDGFYIFVPCQNHKEQVRKAAPSVLVEFTDPRRISAEQRKKAHVLLGYIADWYGGTPLETVKVLTKEMFRGQEYSIAEDEFSLSDCSMEAARLYITWLIDFCVLHNIWTGDDPLSELAEDIPRYVWACLLNKRCAICGKKAQLHHVDRVGMSRNRKTINHLGMKALPLCRKHHADIHNAMSEADFMTRHFLEPVKIDRRIAKVYRLNTGG